MSIYLYVVDPKILQAACRRFIELTKPDGSNWVVEDIDRFNKATGLTFEIYSEYAETDKLRVNGVTYKKLELLTSGGDLLHWQTMFRMIEVKYGGKTKTETDGDGEQ